MIEIPFQQNRGDRKKEVGEDVFLAQPRRKRVFNANKIITMLLFLSVAGGVAAQVAQDVRYWSPQRLKWAEFAGNPRDNGGASEFACYFDCLPVVDTLGGARVNHYTLLCGMDRRGSWVTHPNDKELAYNQVLFDMGELICVRMRPLLTDATRAEEAPQAAADLWQVEASKFHSASSAGRNDTVVARWGDSIRREIQSCGTQRLDVDYAKGVGVGFQLGLGCTPFLGDLGALVRPAFTLNFDVVLLYGNSNFMFSIQSAFAHSKADMYANVRDASVVFASGYPVDFHSQLFRYGYTVVETGGFRATPFVGIGHTQMSLYDPYIRRSYSNGGFGCQVGAFLDWRFRNWQDLTLVRPVGMEFNMRFSLFLTYHDIPNARGCSLNFGLALGWRTQNGR